MSYHGNGFSMSNPRKKYSDAQNVALLSQVNGVCPLCAEILFYKKGGKSYKNYEIAHIYPLNPTPTEKTLLEHEERLSNDVNDENNVIPLCEICHGKFDKPRTVEEYRMLLGIKKRAHVVGSREVVEIEQIITAFGL